VSNNERNQLLWQWKCNLTQGRAATCLAWNHDRHDLAAVGYGCFTFGQKQDGLVCIWSMRNPSYPLWWFRLESGVTTIDFSKATGMHIVQVFDVTAYCD
jgi:dynein intermediate chain 4, axonemal